MTYSVLQTTELSVTDANVGDTLLAISVVFSDDIVLNLNEKIKKKKNQKKKTFTVGLDKTVGRTRTSKQFFFFALSSCDQ